ncbi:T9SS type A sorting domain-containing protein [Tenacibaculum amylolyticum]|uniref:T9SS type A sorting domain-containing protein n=1 Tax=Tenacibaculum amylolyticum TaxID=104269 RepID=UPI0038945C5F
MKNYILLVLILNCSLLQAQDWVHDFYLTAPVPKSLDRYGSAVCLNDDFMFVGASLDDEANIGGGADEATSNSGAVYVYDKNYNLTQKLFQTTPTKSAYFGNSIDADNNFLTVGAYYGRHDEKESAREGLAYVYEKDVNGLWQPLKTLMHENANSFDLFGRNVALSGDNILVTANGEDEGEKSSGAAFIFNKNEGGVNNWGQKVKLKASDPQKNAYLGWSGDLDSDHAVLGAYLYDHEGINNSGAAYVFKNTNGTWSEEIKLVADTPEAGMDFGYDVAIYGNYIAVSAPYTTVNGLTDAGKVFIFNNSNTGWVLESTIVSPNPSEDAKFGFKIALHENKVVVSAKGYNNGTGKVYAFHKVGDQWNSASIETNDAIAGDEVGYSICLTKYSTVFGVEKTDNSGAIFKFNDVNALSNNEFELSAESLAIYPNPSVNKKITLLTHDESLLDKTTASIFTLTGKEVFSQEIHSKRVNLDLNNLHTGIYFCKIKTGTSQLVKKIIIR